jgi:hypothetical protein
MENLSFITFGVLLVFGILQIILFFKVWGMTNDVNKIKEIAKEKNNISWDAAKMETLAENYDKAYEIYFKCFIFDVYELYKKAGDASDYYNDEYKKLVDIYTNRLDTLEGNYSINSEKYDSFDKMRTLLYRQ